MARWQHAQDGLPRSMNRWSSWLGGARCGGVRRFPPQMRRSRQRADGRWGSGPLPSIHSFAAITPPTTMPQGRGHRGSRVGQSKVAPAGPAPAPLRDASNQARAQGPAAAALKLAAPAAPAAAAAAAAAAEPELPGLADDGLPLGPCGRLPVAEEAFAAFGDALGCLRCALGAKSPSQAADRNVPPTVMCTHLVHHPPVRACPPPPCIAGSAR